MFLRSKNSPMNSGRRKEFHTCRGKADSLFGRGVVGPYGGEKALEFGRAGKAVCTYCIVDPGRCVQKRHALKLSRERGGTFLQKVGEKGKERTDNLDYES